MMRMVMRLAYRVLQHIATQVLGVIRANDFFARFSGDEFCLILENIISLHDLQVTLDKILKAVATPVLVGGSAIRMTMSLGVARYPEAGESGEILLQHADEAMYLAKRNQNNHYVIYQP